jgi:regulator of sirC expression with transglutaminase-like and TPR domain
MSEAEARFAAIVRLSGDRIPLAEAALWIAKEEYPDLDVEAYVDRLDELADQAHRRTSPFPPAETVVRFNHFLFRELGFAGNSESYDDPRNSFLNEVLDRRLGIPITLSLVYTEIGRRIGFPVIGVGFPGHFLVKWLGEKDVLVDPFFAKVVSPEECLQRLRASYGPEARLDPRMLDPASSREILVRMLRNLKHNYLAVDDLVRALRCLDRMLLVVPDDPRELRDRGLLYQRLECFAAAVRDFERYLELVPSDAAAAEIRGLMPELRRQAERLN